MDIDLLFTKQGEAGLICSQNLAKKAIGVTFDNLTGLFIIEFADMDQLECNIPADQGFWHALEYNQQIHLGSIKNKNIAQANQIPLLFLDDPYRGEKLGRSKPHPQPLAAFSHFIARCAEGQPIHRDDLDNDEASNCILGDASPASLQFAPHLARQHALEVRPSAAPSAPGFSAPGLGGSTSTSSGGYYSSGNSSDDE